MSPATNKIAAKTAKSKKQVTSEPEDHVEAEGEQEERDTDIIPNKNKKPIEIDESEADAGLDEKIDADPLFAGVEEDDLSDDGGLDGEELNPFGDRWEE